MPKITLDGRTHDIEAGTTVLEGLLRDGVSIPHSCRNGICQSCLMRVVEGAPPADSQKGLKEVLRMQGYFLPCICRPAEDLEIAAPGAGAANFVDATVVGKEMLGDNIIRLRLRTETPVDYRPGQFVNLRTRQGLVRSYSIASVPDLDDTLEFHIRKLPDGRVSGWVHEVLRSGDSLEIQGPVGDCFYLPGRPEQPLLLIGTGSGLAPLWGIVRDALRQGHTAPIWLYHGSRHAGGLYLVDDLRELSRTHPDFHYVPCLSGENAPHGVRSGRAAHVALEDHPDLKGWRVYLCGHPDMVAAARRKAFLAGAGMKDIHADAFRLNLPVGESAVA
jgi:NAD(P)H-flavin reductase/ferredoxin